MTQVVWITGGAGGMGQHLANAFYLRGYRVLVTDLHHEQLSSAALQLGWDESSVLLRQQDVTCISQWELLLAEITERWGKVDYLLNVAGYLRPGYAYETPIEETDRHFDINVKGLIYGSQLVARHMIERRRGHIINIASMASLAAIPGLSLYSASKFAVRAFSLALAQELKPYGVKVSVLCPDAVQTPMLELQEEYEEAALTFSGPKVLSVNDIEYQLFEKVIPKAPLETILPCSRGALAKLGNLFPALTGLLEPYLRSKGRSVQKSRHVNR
jgi:3-oxoacyl-[acyl-carrier protein] reductase